MNQNLLLPYPFQQIALSTSSTSSALIHLLPELPITTRKVFD